MAKTMNFSSKERKSFGLFGIILVVILSCVIGATLAFFFHSDWASGYINMSGKVSIEAVGAGNASIEDDATCNLVINLDKNYPVLIPGMDINMPANVKVYQSTTSPLLRARLDMELIDTLTMEEDADSLRVIQDMYGQLTDVIESNDWYLYTDSYYYYVGNYSQNTQGGGYNFTR